MHTIHVVEVSPLVMSAALRRGLNCWVTHDGLPRSPVDWLTRYWQDQLVVACPDRHDYDGANRILLRLADALAIEDVTEAVDFVIDYRQFTDRPTNDSTLTRMMLDALLDWSKWCGSARIDDARAQSWLRSLLS